jgi:cytochrome c
MIAGFAAVWLTIGANEMSHLLVPQQKNIENYGYVIEVPEGFGSGVAVVEEDVLEDIKPMLASASVDDGAKVARKCQSCHTFDQGQRNGTGPNLYNVVGASLEMRERGGYALTDSLLAGADFWTYDDLNVYLADPKKMAPKGVMSFAGLRKAKDRANIIKFLMSKTESPPTVILDSVAVINTEVNASIE